MSVLDVFLFAINAVSPIVLIIFLGYFLRRINFFDDHFLKLGNKLMFRCALPIMLFFNVYSIEKINSVKWETVGFAVGVVFVLFLLGLLTVALFVPDKKQKGVVLQCCFRSNFAIIGVPIAGAIGGEKALAVTSVIMAFSIIVFNILAVVSLTVFLPNEDDCTKKVNLSKIFGSIASNPLIISIMLGVFALLVREILPKNDLGHSVFSIEYTLPFVFSAIKTVAGMATPLALIVLGGQFTFSASKGVFKQIVLGTVMKIIIAPAIGLGGAVVLNNFGVLTFTPADLATFVALFGSPVAVSSAIMASQMKNDDILAGQYVVWTGVLSIFTIFISIVLLKFGGLI